MIAHTDLGDTPFGRSRTLKELINNSEVKWGGNKRLKIYGTLSCVSGKRMKAENRVFFQSEHEAKEMGYRPCAHCMRQAYVLWKADSYI
jgi:methylphosphotriester-DNA--protein-cysteine methyltransferase